MNSTGKSGKRLSVDIVDGVVGLLKNRQDLPQQEIADMYSVCVATIKKLAKRHRVQRVQGRKKGLEPAFNWTFWRYKRQAKQRGLPFELSKEQFRKLVFKDCYYCGEPPMNVTKRHSDEVRYNGVDRLDSLQGYIEGNCVPCCVVCNRMKMDLSLSVFLERVQRIVSKLFNKNTVPLEGTSVLRMGTVNA